MEDCRGLVGTPVFPGDMTARGAAAAVLRGFEVQGDFPFAERDRFPDMFGPPGGMDIVADNAPSPLLGVVHMEIMEVLLPVPEICCRRRTLFEYEILIVTLEAKGVTFHLKWGVERRGECLFQHPPFIRAVGIVTGRTITIQNRAVMFGIPLQIFFHILNVACGGLSFSAMTLQTEFHTPCLELVSQI
jgi:hypothetical protein